jgi:heterodisulfide reductase subunit B
MNRYFKTNYHMPILYFTQLMGLAFGKSAEELGIGKEFVDARPALKRIGIELPPAEPVTEVRKPRKKDEGLPMPKMPAQNAPASGQGGKEEVK